MSTPASDVTSPLVVGDWVRGFDGRRWHVGRVVDPVHPRGVRVDEPDHGRVVRIAARWIGPREAAVDLLLERWAAVEHDAEELDDAYDGHSAGEAVKDAAAAYGDPDEDDGHASLVQFACCVAAMESAVADVDADYRDVGPPNPARRTGWDAEAFPRAALGL